MKQFNSNEYIANPSLKVMTRNGHAVRIICTDVKDKYPVVGIVKLKENHEETHTFKENGEYFEDAEDALDLFLAPKKKEGWVNIYRMPDTDELETSIIFSTKEEAEFYRGDNPNYVATTKITWED